MSALIAPTIHVDALLCRRQDLRLRPIDDGALLYDPVRDSVHYLNTTALCVWHLCDGVHSIATIAQKLHDEFDGIEFDIVEADVIATCTQLLNDALLIHEAAA